MNEYAIILLMFVALFLAWAISQLADYMYYERGIRNRFVAVVRKICHEGF